MTKNYLPFGLTVVLGLAFWQLTVGLGGVPAWLLPAPADIIRALLADRDLLLRHTLVTLGEVGWGFGTAILAAIALALIMDAFPWFKKAFYPFVVISQTIPIILIAPLLVIWFGYGLLPKVVVISLVCFFPIAINLLDGLEKVDGNMLALMTTMQATTWQKLLWLKVPAALPYFFSGLKVAAAYSVMGAVIGEWLGASAGLGVFMTRAQKSFAVDKVFAAILIISLSSILIFLLVKISEKISMPWLAVEKQKEKKNEKNRF